MYMRADVAHVAFLGVDDRIQCGFQRSGVEHFWWRRLDRPSEEMDVRLDPWLHAAAAGVDEDWHRMSDPDAVAAAAVV